MSTVQPRRSRRTAPVARDDCPLAAAAELFGRRWMLLILRELLYGVDRFDDLQADLGVSSSTLSDRLTALEQQGLIERRSYQDEGQRRRARYALTESGHDLTVTFWALTEWSEEHLTGRAAPTRLMQSSTGRPVSVRVENDLGEPVDWSDLTWRFVRR